WILDSGASKHIVKDRTVLYNAKKRSGTIGTLGDQELKYELRGNVKILVGDNTITLTKVLYVPDATENLVAEGRLARE
ncbi:hypothetical protein BCV69DRAFT_303870, partial [Microstroma glucosiphilum]